MFQLLIDQSIIERYSAYSALVVYGEGFRDDSTTRSRSLELLQERQRHFERSFPFEDASQHPHIAAWRETFASFGVKPSRVLCGAEALMKRVLNGNELPDVCSLVNVYNGVSLTHAMPIGGENWDALESDLTLHLAKGNEPFGTRADGEPIVEFPEAGEPIWSDIAGCTCRRWNWRQCTRTALVDGVQKAYFVLDATLPYGADELAETAKDLMESLHAVYPSATLKACQLIK